MPNFESQIEVPKPFFERIQEQEVELFPEFLEKPSESIDLSLRVPSKPKASLEVISPDNRRYMYFSPSWHFRHELITEEIVKKFIENKNLKMLSVGAGPAYLERFLVYLGMDRNNITLADEDPIDIPEGFDAKIFDMRSEWPDFEGKEFDLILFPEVPILDDVSMKKFLLTDEENIETYTALFGEALKHLRVGGEIRMTGNNLPDQVLEKVEENLRNAGHVISIDKLAFPIIVKKEITKET